MESDEFNALIKLMRDTSVFAADAATDAAAQVFKQAAIAAAPRKSGQLAKSIKIIKGRKTRSLIGTGRERVFVGPEKRKGYYGYFLEKGYRLPAGSAQQFETRSGRRFTTRRIARTGRGAAHSQRGLTSFKQIPPRPWFEPAVRSAEGSATSAAESAFDRKLYELDSR